MKNKVKERIGQETINNQGYSMKIIDYINNKNIIVKFQDEYQYQTNATYDNFIKGKIKNPYAKEIFNIGIVGIEYDVQIYKKEFAAWKHMIERCYNTSVYHTYHDVTCCNEWLFFPNFCKWIHEQENYKVWNSENKWAVDKDILIKGNKIYSPDTCCLVPQFINTLFLKCDKSRGDLPIGVHYDSDKHRYVAQYRNNNGVRFLGGYQNYELAFNAYKQAKEKYIKQIAQEEYDKCNITKKCYDAMMNYEVEITD